MKIFFKMDDKQQDDNRLIEVQLSSRAFINVLLPSVLFSLVTDITANYQIVTKKKL